MRLLTILIIAIREVIIKNQISLRNVFERADLVAEIEKSLAEAGYRTELLIDEEANLAEIEIRFENDKWLIFDWNLANHYEFLQLINFNLDFPSEEKKAN